MERNVISENNEPKKEAYLLYWQYLDLIKLYYSKYTKIEGENSNKFKQYYLVDKDWINQYKSLIDYNLVVKEANQYEYDEFLEKLEQKIKLYGRETIKKLKSSESLKKQMYNDYIIPQNFDIIKPGTFDPNFEKEFTKYDVIFDNQHIIIFDYKNIEPTKKAIFICSIQFNENTDDITDYYINIDYILSLFNQSERNFFSNEITYNSIESYFKSRNIQINYNQQQNIYDKGQIVGLFKPFFNINIRKGQKNDDLLSLDDLKNKYPDYFKNKNRRPKCITISGDLYYYLNENNCEISEYINSNNNNNSNDNFNLL